MAKTIFLTGSTGFVGSNLAYELLKQGYSLKLLVRDKKIKAKERFTKYFIPLLEKSEEFGRIKKQIEIISGDITLYNLGILPAVYKRVLSEVDLVFHNAALTSFGDLNIKEIEKNNIDGTKNILDFTSKLKQKRFHYMSTAYIYGQSNEVFSEDDLDIGQNFTNPYEESKFKAEKLINEYKEKFNIEIVIYRPSIIVGDSRTGRTSNFLGVYSFIKALYFLFELFNSDLKRKKDRALAAGVSYIGGKLNIPLRVCADPEKTLNVVPIDYVVNVVKTVLRKQNNYNKVFHIVNKNPLSLGEFNSLVQSILNISGIRLVNNMEFIDLPMTEWERFFINSLSDVAVYLGKKEPMFSDRNTLEILDGEGISCPQIDREILTKLITFYLNSIRIKR